MRTQVATKKPRKNARPASTQVRERPLGSNVPLYLKNRGYGAQHVKQILKEAQAVAVERESRIVRLEHVMFADGTITENDFGSPRVEQLRRSLFRKRLGHTAPRSQRTTKPPVARPRQQRTKAPKIDD